MTNQNNAAQAANANPLSDEYVNAVIQQHGYQSPDTVIARLNQWIGLHGGQDSVTLLMYEAHKALSKLHAEDEPAYWVVEHAGELFRIFNSSEEAEDCAARGVPRENFSSRPLYAAPQASSAAQPTEADPKKWGGEADMNDLANLAAALGHRDWKWWDSCSFRRLTFEERQHRRDGSALRGRIQAYDQHPDVEMAPGVRDFIEAASPMAVGELVAQLDRAASHLRECIETLGDDQADSMRAARAVADCADFLKEIGRPVPHISRNFATNDSLTRQQDSE